MAASELDLVHLGNRNLVAEAQWPLGVLPPWLSDPDQTGPQASSFPGIELRSFDQIGLLFQIANGSGIFLVELGFASGPPVSVAASGPDWFGVGPEAPAPGQGFVSQFNIGAFPHVYLDDAEPASGVLKLTETVIGVEQLQLHGLGDHAGRVLTSLTIRSSDSPNYGVGVVSAARLSTDPLDPDSDGDGLLDGEEVNVHASNPLDGDTDGDGFADGEEVAQNTDPLDSQSFPIVVPVPLLAEPGRVVLLLMVLVLATGMIGAGSRSR